MKKNFKYVVLFVILFIPFIYSFFYLKAYWNPYGKGNIDNLPVAVINEDEGKNGNKIVDAIKNSKKLKLSVVESKKAENGLYSGKYYAIIKVPKDFTSSMESASTKNKKHATITYSPNQKANFLASQIINTVVLNVEKNLDNQANSKIVKSLSDNLKEVPDKLDTINNGFDKLSKGTKELKDGSQKISAGSNDLASNYSKFNNGVLDVKNGSNTLYNSLSELNNGINTLDNEVKNFDTLKVKLGELATGVSTLKNGSDSYTTNFDKYVYGVDNTFDNVNNLIMLINAYICPDQSTPGQANICAIAQGLNADYEGTGMNIINYLKVSGSSLKDGNNTINLGINTLNDNVANLSIVNDSINKLQSGVSKIKNGSNLITSGAYKLNDGLNTLNTSSNQILDGVNTLNEGNNKLNSGIITLNSSVNSAKNSLATKTSDTKESIEKVESLDEYSENPVNVKTKEVNKVNSYGTAFTPLFVSVGLWVGCLMMFMVLYYDKEERFGIFGINDNRLVKRTLAYHGLISISSIVLGLCLDVFLDLSITNYALYYLTFILIGNLFMSLILFLITNFKDIGKFIALILLVMQLAASAGTFPIETVTKGFRWMNAFLPMTYSIRLLKESLVKVEGSLLSKSLVVIIILFIVFFAINIVKAKIDEKKAN